MTPHEAPRSAVGPCISLWMTAISNRDGTAPPAGTRERIGATFDLPVLRFAVVGDDTNPDGFALTTPDGVVRLLAVDPRSAGRGVGRILLDDAIAAVRNAHLPVVELAVRTGNQRAISLYESAGMIPDRDPVPHPLGGQPMLTYRLSLS